MSYPPRPPSGAGDNLSAILALLDQLRPALAQDDRARAAAAFQQAALLAHVGMWAQAYAVIRAWRPDTPDPATYAHSRGAAALHLGHTDEAREQLDRATRLRPQSGSAWLTFSTLLDFSREPELADRLIGTRPPEDSAGFGERASYFYALGKAHADLGERARAFAAFAEGARQAKSEVPYDRAEDRAAAESAVAGYDAEAIAALASRQSEPTDRTIFVAGLPRSGTTLVEQILTSHSAVSDGGETTRLALFARDIRGLSYPNLREYVERVGAPEAARLWRHWMDERFPGPGRVVDKTTTNGRMLGLAAALLPQAPLLWITRDPLDCAWSCFRTYFSGGQPWTYDLEDIAYHFRLEDRLLAQWRQILGERLLVIPYESLASEPEPWIRRLLAHGGLPEEPQPFAPHENPRAVATASTMQVRRPINRAGIGAAEPYREFLQPFVEAYRA
ncbi:MAG: hypothetical protein B7Z08_09205 [Sphingomonadales bacterium 32-68-7]|nr:MAG: hypothetical protein B7Z08_09205 [Sphingomonadales bacterium 32-68-7]